MLIDINTKDLLLKKDDLMIYDGKLLVAISKDELLKSIVEEMKKDKKRISDLERDILHALRDIKELKILEASL